MPTFFGAVIQSRPSLTTTPNATHFRPLPLRGTAPKASKFFSRQSTQDVAGRPPRLGPCTASRPNMTRFESLESPCRTRAPANPSWHLRIAVWMRSEPVLSRTSPYDRGLYPVRSLRRKSMYYTEIMILVYEGASSRESLPLDVFTVQYSLCMQKTKQKTWQNGVTQIHTTPINRALNQGCRYLC